MNLDESLKIIAEAYPDFKTISVVDYDNYFVFNITPSSHSVEKNGEWLGGLVAVDKMFKLTKHFIPLDHNQAAFEKAVRENTTYF